MNPQPLAPFWASSQDPNKVSTTVSGAIVGASSIIIAVVAAFFHLTLSATDVISLGEGLGLVAGAIVFILGLAHKLIQKFGKAKPVI